MSAISIVFSMLMMFAVSAIFLTVALSKVSDFLDGERERYTALVSFAALLFCLSQWFAIYVMGGVWYEVAVAEESEERMHDKLERSESEFESVRRICIERHSHE